MIHAKTSQHVLREGMFNNNTILYRMIGVQNVIDCHNKKFTIIIILLILVNYRILLLLLCVKGKKAKACDTLSLQKG